MSGNADIDGLLWGYRWTFSELTYAFPTDTAEYLDNGYVEINGFTAMDAPWQAAILEILAGITGFITLDVVPTPPDEIATFRFGGAAKVNYTDDGTVAQATGLHVPGNGTAEANPPDIGDDFNPPYSAPYAQGDVWFNLANYPDIRPGTYGYSAGIMHEIGHSFGLKHGHASQYAHGEIFPKLPYQHNSYEYSVMT